MNFCSYNSKSLASVVPSHIPRLPFIGKRMILSFVLFSLCFVNTKRWIIEEERRRFCLFFHFLEVFRRAFTIFRTVSSFSSVNYHRLISSWTLISSSVVLSVVWMVYQWFQGFSSTFLKCSFHFWHASSWLTAFNFAHKLLLLHFTSLTISCVYWDCLSSPEFLILFIWFWMSFSCFGFRSF